MMRALILLGLAALTVVAQPTPLPMCNIGFNCTFASQCGTGIACINYYSGSNQAACAETGCSNCPAPYSCFNNVICIQECTGGDSSQCTLFGCQGICTPILSSGLYTCLYPGQANSGFCPSCVVPTPTPTPPPTRVFTRNVCH